MRLSNQPDIIARLARGDINMPDFGGFPVDKQIIEIKFEAAVYTLLQLEPGILASRLLYHRPPVKHDGPPSHLQDISGRRLTVFERAEGGNNAWYDLNEAQMVGTCPKFYCDLVVTYVHLGQSSCTISSYPGSFVQFSTATGFCYDLVSRTSIRAKATSAPHSRRPNA